jgi:hypothetical protein
MMNVFTCVFRGGPSRTATREAASLHRDRDAVDDRWMSDLSNDLACLSLSSADGSAISDQDVGHPSLIPGRRTRSRHGKMI